MRELPCVVHVGIEFCQDASNAENAAAAAKRQQSSKTHELYLPPHAEHTSSAGMDSALIKLLLEPLSVMSRPQRNDYASCRTEPFFLRLIIPEALQGCDAPR